MVTHPGEIKNKLDGWTHVGADGETHADTNINNTSIEREGADILTLKQSMRQDSLLLQKLGLQS